jgi:hypothetical protein
MVVTNVQCTKFIDIDSTYRNRQEYPNPGDFIVKSTTTTICGTVNGVTAVDPVLNGYPIIIFQGDIITASASFAGGIPNKPILPAPTDPTTNYRGALLTNTTLTQSVYIEAYDTISRTAYLGTEGFSPTFQVANAFTIVDPSTSSQIFISGGSALDNAYVGYYLYDVTINETRPIVEYDGIVSTLIVEPPFSGAWAVTDLYEIRKDPNVFIRAVTYYISNNSISIQNPPNNDLVGKYVRVTELASPLYNMVRRIIAYDVTTDLATISPYFPVTTPITDPTAYEVLPMSYDNCYFVNGMSSCRFDKGMYEISLQSIILPNQTILSGYGGRLASYPYVYIEFGNLSNGVQNILVSNNPNSSKTIFKVPIYDIQPRLNSTFLKIDRTNMPQLIFFNPYEDYYFKITMPNGDPYIIQADNMSPLPPNPELQVSVTFKVVRINNP